MSVNPQQSRNSGTTRIVLLTLPAKLDTISLTVDVDPETDVVTLLPSGTTLEDGRPVIRISVRYIGVKEAPRPRGLPATWAEGLRDILDDAASNLRLAKGQTCSRCGNNHPWTSRKEKLKTLESFVSWAEREAVATFLLDLINNREDALEGLGYGAMDEVRANRLFLQELISEIDTLLRTANAPAAEASGEGASQQ